MLYFLYCDHFLYNTERVTDLTSLVSIKGKVMKDMIVVAGEMMKATSAIIRHSLMKIATFSKKSKFCLYSL